MKKIFLAAISIVCLMASCSKDGMETPAVNPLAGNEVMFTSSVGEATRTLYGEEYDNSIAVKWVTGDLISVYGVDCAVQQADYKVTAAETAVTENNMNYYYASSLDKTGAAGVQWGENATSDFFAVYPSTSNSFKANTDGSATVTTTVRAAQNVAFEETEITVDGETKVLWTSQHYNGTSSNPTMTDAVMYAYTKEASATNADGTAKAVDLKFKPFSTVLRFTMKGFQSYMKDGENDISKDSELAVTRIILTAPTGINIAGDFDLTINSDGTASATNGTTNQITIYPEYLPLENGEWVQFDVFTIPMSDVKLSATTPWTVTTETTLGTFTYQLIPQKLVDGTLTNSDAPLTAGALHKLTIPQKKVYLGFEIPAQSWLEYIPRNVYLTELSYPGSWYSTTSGYQDETSITSQWGNGVRAFHIDCRMSASSRTISWNGVSWGDLELVCTGTEDSGTAQFTYTPGTPVLDKLTEIANQITEEEFAVVVLTIAEKPLTNSSLIVGGSTIEPATVLAEIEAVLAANATELKLYTNTITPTTIVNEILGKMIVKVNANVEKTIFTTYSNVPSTLISAASMASDEDYITGDIFGSTGDYAISNLFTAMQNEPLYWGKTAISPAMSFYYHQAQQTNTSEDATSGNSTPSIYDRKLAIDDIVSQSDKIYYSNEKAWYQIAVGGYTGSGNSINYENVATPLNGYIKSIIDAKLNQTTFTTTSGSEITMKPSPLGIVLMNKVTSETGLEVVEKILKMNTSFHLQRDTSKPEWPNGSPFENADSDTPTADSTEDETPDEYN